MNDCQCKFTFIAIYSYIKLEQKWSKFCISDNLKVQSYKKDIK